MCALGGAVESVITIATPRFISFFLLIWIIGTPPSSLSSPTFVDAYASDNRSECLRVRLPTRASPWGLQLWLCDAVL